MPRLIDANALITEWNKLIKRMVKDSDGKTPVNFGLVICELSKAPTVDAYTEEQVADILRKADELESRNRELEKELVWLKNCLNCKIRKECPRHCGKVVHNCDHWEYGDSTVDAVEVVRCKDCKHGMKSRLHTDRHPKPYLCTKTWEGGYHETDYYCAYGERKDNDC